ncbi:putative 5-methylcytosine restriction system, catalytic subunit [Thermococcus sp. 4557]|uniref:5-methylcytosine restriction system specificity protein McrC n=1 Tax=Thermococcus sp. (strain CGMCC 1.5172 / 4557) TaxID=1042877 RepID=UPI000219EA12|nr:restriction endonuclease [Thermococcus sp. 4557]AEK72121.1 putative 5-methylcytosine restriction system, catalytic subunit [Thermococcus sp. 4557]
MKRITLYEFQRKYLSTIRMEGMDVTPESLQRFFEVINSLYGREHEVLSLKYDTRRGEYYIKAHGSVGFAYHLSEPGFMVQVLPRPYRHDPDESRSLRFFLSLMNLSGGLGLGRKEIDDAVAIYARGEGGVHELFMYLYVYLLGRELFHGLYRGYSEVEEELQTIRGRVLLSRLARRPPLGRDVPVRHAVLDVDTPLNRVLRAALEVVVEVSAWEGVARSAEALVRYFADVGPLRQDDIKRVSFNPLNERFRPIFHLATMILMGFGKLPGKGLMVPGIFIEMDRLFEDLVYHTVLTAISGRGRVHRQHPLPPIVRDAEEIGARTGAVFTFGPPRPDIFVQMPEGRCILEVKYRNLSVKMGDTWWRKLVRSSSELYQVYSYSRISGGGALLVYPRLMGQYNGWLPDMFDESIETFSFFDGTPLGIVGYELSRIGREVLIARRGVVIDGKIAGNVRSLLESVCALKGERV